MGKSVYLVWDGGDSIQVPEILGSPSKGQLAGTVAENLAEVGGRSCYFSLGRGRDSAGFHENILKVQHYSIHEHFNHTVEIDIENAGAVGRYAVPLVNRPGVWFRVKKYFNPDKLTVRITYNPRVILDWDKFVTDNCWNQYLFLKDALHYWMYQRAERVVGFPEGVSGRLYHRIVTETKVVEPETDEEKWISVFMIGSRGFSHEQVRHGDFTAISQRSTRYCDESGSTHHHHPLIEAAVRDPELPVGDCDILMSAKASAPRVARLSYKAIVPVLQSYLVSKGVGKVTARKQARGASRGYLGNGIETSMLFSASVAQWRWMMGMRCSDPADAEIRLIYNDALPILQGSRFADRFADIRLEDAKDGLGKVAVFKGSQVTAS